MSNNQKKAFPLLFFPGLAILTLVFMLFMYVSITKGDEIHWKKNLPKEYSGLAEAEDGTWYYVKNGEPDYSFHSLAFYNGSWFYVKNGQLDWDFSGLVDYYGTAYYIENGMLHWEYSGLINDSGHWHYVKEGKVDTGYSDLIYYNGSWFYVHNGVIDWSYNTLSQVNGRGSWYYVQNGMIDWSYTGLAEYYGTWYYINKGTLNWNYTGLTNYYGTWYYVRNGAVDWNYSGLCYYQGAWFYVNKGMLDWSYSNLVYYQGNWYYVHKGMIDWTISTLSQVDNKGAWYYVKNGQLDWSYTGLSLYYGTWYYIEKGRVNWNYTGMSYYNGSWFYVKQGVLDWSYYGWVQSGNATFYVENGRAVTNTWKEKDGFYYYFGGSGYMTTETRAIDGRLEVFRMDGKWIDTSSLDVKAAKYSSNTNYLILVDLDKRVTKIYKNNNGTWRPEKLFLCTVGDSSRGWDTVKGDFYIGYSSWGNPYTRGDSFNDSEGHTLYYWTRFCDDFLFHSILYDGGTYNVSTSGNSLGEELSHGCVRLRIENAQWINSSIPDGTRVIVY